MKNEGAKVAQFTGNKIMMGKVNESGFFLKIAP